MNTKLSLSQVAAYYIEQCAVSVLPVGMDKRPIGSWKRWQSEIPDPSDVSDRRALNLGIVAGQVSGIVVVDCDSRENAEWFWNHGAKTNVMANSPRGVHFYFRHPRTEMAPNTAGVKRGGVARYDVRGDGGYVVAPPSVTLGGEYRWVDGYGLTAKRKKLMPFYDPAWGREEEAKPAEIYSQDSSSDDVFERGARILDVAAWIRKVHAVSGQGGHGETFRVACKIAESGVSFDEGLKILADWNQTNAEPPWTPGELRHKLTDAFKGS